MTYEGVEVTLENCSNAGVFTLDGTPLSEVDVYMIGGEIRLVFEQDCYDRLDAEERVSFYDGELGVVNCRCSLYDYRFERKAEDGRILYGSGCNIIEVESIVQRRADYKARIKVPFEIVIRDRRGESGVVPALAVDISAGGIGFRSGNLFQKNEIITFTLKLERRMLLQAEILHKTPEDAKPGEEVRYGCRFVGLNMGSEVAIRQYAYRRQLLEKKGTFDRSTE